MANASHLLFGGMEKLGQGGNDHTRHVLRLLPKQPFHVVVDAGCGAGRQTLVLAEDGRALAGFEFGPNNQTNGGTAGVGIAWQPSIVYDPRTCISFRRLRHDDTIEASPA